MIHSWPALIIGCLLLAYWARVVRMAYKFRRRDKIELGANFIPPEPVGRLLRLMWIPLVVLWIVFPLLEAMRERLPWLLNPLVQWPVMSWSAVFIAAAAFAATWVCWKRMGKSWRMGINPAEKTQLIVSGPYSYVRHPIYGLSSALMLATLAAVLSPMMILVALAHLSLLQWEARREENHLSRLHGQAYRDYADRTGRFIPIRRRRRSAS